MRTGQCRHLSVAPYCRSMSACWVGVEDSARTGCRYWNATARDWRTDGVVTLGFVTIGGTKFLRCGTVHLTAFVGSVSLSGIHFEANAVNLVGDAGELKVCLGVMTCSSPLSMLNVGNGTAAIAACDCCSRGLSLWPQ